MRKLILGVCLTLAAASAGAQNAQSVASEWRLEIAGDAESAGRITLEVSPEIGAPIRASAQIADGRSETQVAESLRDALQLAAGTRYKVEVEGEDVVLTKRTTDEREFVIAVVENTVQGVTIETGTE